MGADTREGCWGCKGGRGPCLPPTPTPAAQHSAPWAVPVCVYVWAVHKATTSLRTGTQSDGSLWWLLDMGPDRLLQPHCYCLT